MLRLNMYWLLLNGWTDKQKDGRKDRWIEGWTDRQLECIIDIFKGSIKFIYKLTNIRCIWKNPAWIWNRTRDLGI